MEKLKQELKKLIITSLDLEDITIDDIKDDEPLFIEGLGLDSIDALELGVAIKKQYQVKLDANSADNKKHFTSINTLAAFVSRAA
ncbi:phosphopantetheine-binding protein [Endozoicomonas sp.]|uniref:phosphopantetheine-binding protein n=1 Tax=Endozoicomonas sp. TaxID=1892382 RepID=UPI002884C54F|nr:phosphopantetheine-binding protein [Endozoicomonas sp.]